MEGDSRNLTLWSGFPQGHLCPEFGQVKEFFLVYVGRNRKMTEDAFFPLAGAGNWS
jgi:hypothetical protein